MASLSKSEIIKTYPIGPGLDKYRDDISSACAKLGVPVSLDGIQLLRIDDLKDVAIGLFSWLIGLSAARHLLSPNGQNVLSINIAKFYVLLFSDNDAVKSVIPLYQKVIDYAADEDIWDVVALLVSSHVIPPVTPRAATFGTPVKPTSSSLQGSDQVQSELDRRIFQEIMGYVYQGTKGFYQKYFEEKSWSSTVDRMIDDARRPGRWEEYPNPPTQRAVLDWFLSFQDQFLTKDCSIYSESCNTAPAGSDWNRIPDLILTLRGTAKRGDEKLNWADVQFIGELKQSETRTNLKDELVEFCGQAREVFRCQPTRRFLHGCFIRGSMVEPWVFDRSGIYSGNKFDIRKDPSRFIRLMAGYALMSAEELGINMYIQEDQVGKYIMFKGDHEESETRLDLYDRLIASPQAIVSRGTTCYQAKRQNSKDWEFVVKFSWRLDERGVEGELLRKVTKRNVRGVARLFGHQDLGSIADLRQGLEFGSLLSFQGQKRKRHGGASSTYSKQSRLGIGGEQSDITEDENEQDKKSSRYSVEQPTRKKRTRSGLNYGQLDMTEQEDEHDENEGKHDENEDEHDENEGKHDENEDEHDENENEQDEKVNEQDEKTGQHSVEPLRYEKGIRSGLNHQNNRSFDNRILSCLVISPLGRPISKAESIKEFLEACRDIVKALRSLYQEGGILHRDVSVNNLIITNLEKEGEPKGMLIDLDLAEDLEDDYGRPRYQTGTLQFMAIGVLDGEEHTYRHDLESFFYVFLWVIIYHGLEERGEDLPIESRLRCWWDGSYESIADMKSGQMDKRQFQRILNEFPPEMSALKELGEELRQALFPIREDWLFTGTDPESNELYELMIKAFEDAIKRNA